MEKYIQNEDHLLIKLIDTPGYRHYKREVMVDQILKIIFLCRITGLIQQERQKIENQRHEKRRN